MAITIITQPNADSINAAYRPIVFKVEATTDNPATVTEEIYFIAPDRIHFPVNHNFIEPGRSFEISGYSIQANNKPYNILSVEADAMPPGMFAIVSDSVINGSSQPATISYQQFYSPVVYCDIYLNDVYYKSLSKTTFNERGTGTNNPIYEFDIQDALQEVLTYNLPTLNGTSVQAKTNSFRLVSVKFRTAALDESGFIYSEQLLPKQATSSSAAVAGEGEPSSAFYVLNSTVQHEEKQDLASLLTTYGTSPLGQGVYPMTKRPQVVKLGKSDSSYFPIFSSLVPATLCVFCTMTDGSTVISCIDIGPGPTCAPVLDLLVETTTYYSADEGEDLPAFRASFTPGDTYSEMLPEFSFNDFDYYPANIIEAGVGYIIYWHPDFWDQDSPNHYLRLSALCSNGGTSPAEIYHYQYDPYCPIVTGLTYTVVNNGDGTQTFTFNWDNPNDDRVQQMNVIRSQPQNVNFIQTSDYFLTVTVELGLYNFAFFFSGNCTSMEENAPSFNNIGIQAGQYCVQWQAQNLNNIKMSLVGQVDLTDILEGRTIAIGACSGTVTSYFINGQTVAADIEMTFNSVGATFNASSLPYVQNKVLIGITLQMEVFFTNGSDITINSNTNAPETPGTQLFASFNNCN